MPTDIAANAPPRARTETAADLRSLGWTCGVIAVIVLLLALFSAQSMKSWAETLAPTPTNLAIKQAAEGWFDVTDHLGLAAPRAGLRSAWTALHQPKFPQAPEPVGDAAPQR